jgi:hypothetical protein
MGQRGVLRPYNGAVNLKDLFNPHPPLRTAAQWRAILEWAVLELEESVGVPGRITDSTVNDDKPGCSSHANGFDVVFDTQPMLGFDLCGRVSCRVRVGQKVGIEGEFLAFLRGIRVPQHAHEHLVYLFNPDSSEPNKWTCTGWMDNEGGWNRPKDNSRWRKK